MSKRSFILPIIFILAVEGSFSARQRIQSPEKQDLSKKEQEQVVRLSVTLVQIDASVTDKQDRPVTDLGSDDFEIFEDGKRQHITNFSYVQAQVPLKEGETPPRRQPKGTSTPPAPPVHLRPEDVRRSIAIVVDDLSLSMASAEAVRYHLRRFVDRQMQAGDMVAIIRASGGMGGLQQFTSDKQQLYSAADRIRWNPQGRAHLGVFAQIRDDSLDEGRKNPRRDPDEVRKAALADSADEFREQLFTVGMLGALNYVIRGLKLLPGRKSVMLFSEGFAYLMLNPARTRPLDLGSSRVQDAMRLLVEFANRSSVVIYGIDPRGVTVPMFDAGDDTAGLTSQQRTDLIGRRMRSVSDSLSGLDYLSQETGGFLVHSSNDIGRGISRVLNDQCGYYLIGYVPEEATFKHAATRVLFHKISVRIKRPGLTVRTRGGFFGVANEESRPARLTPSERLMAAVSSPFASGDIGVKLTSLFDHDQKSGYFVRSLLHIDARDLTFAEAGGGWWTTSIDVAAVTFGDNGIVVDQSIQTDAVKVRKDDLERARQSGILYTINLPLKKPGAYQLRAAVLESHTERVGSANQYIEVPNISRGKLVLSPIAVSGNDLLADLSGSPVTFGDGAEATQATRAEAGAAVRKLRPGDELTYGFVVYNAKMDKATAMPALSMRARLFLGGREVYSGPEAPLRLSAQPDWKRINVTGSLKLTSNVQPGQNTKQISVSDRAADAKHRTATQWTDFEIVE